MERGASRGRGERRPRLPSPQARSAWGPGLGVRGWGPDRAKSELAAPGFRICTSAPPVVSATARCQGQPALLPPRPSRATRCSGQPRSPVPTPAFAHFRFTPVESGTEGVEVGGIPRGPWRAGASLWDGTRSSSPRQRPPSIAERADTTTPSMPRGCWPIPMPLVAQGADGSWSSSLFGSVNECTGCAWGARALGCLHRKDRETPPPCSRSPQPQGLQRPTRLRTRVASAMALVSETRGQSGGKARLGFSGAGFGLVSSVGGLENPGGIVVGILDFE